MKNKTEFTLSFACWPLVVALSLPSLSLIAIPPLPSLFYPRRPPTMSKTIALFDVDGTLTVPRKVRRRFGGGREEEEKERKERVNLSKRSIDRWSRRALPPSSSCRSFPTPRSFNSPFHKQTADSKTLDFLQELRKVREVAKEGRWGPAKTEGKTESTGRRNNNKKTKKTNAQFSLSFSTFSPLSQNQSAARQGRHRRGLRPRQDQRAARREQ